MIALYFRLSMAHMNVDEVSTSHCPMLDILYKYQSQNIKKFFECVYFLALCSRHLNEKNLFPSSHQIKYITKRFENTLFSSSGEASAQKQIKEAKFRKWIVEQECYYMWQNLCLILYISYLLRTQETEKDQSEYKADELLN